ncbi:hypothetical protein ACOSP7_010552 [Xanthoceras sorbifolium]
MNSRTSCTQMVQHCGDGFMQIGLITRTSSHASVHHTLSAGMFTHLVLLIHGFYKPKPSKQIHTLYIPFHEKHGFYVLHEQLDHYVIHITFQLVKATREVRLLSDVGLRMVETSNSRVAGYQGQLTSGGYGGGVGSGGGGGVSPGNNGNWGGPGNGGGVGSGYGGGMGQGGGFGFGFGSGSGGSSPGVGSGGGMGSGFGPGSGCCGNGGGNGFGKGTGSDSGSGSGYGSGGGGGAGGGGYGPGASHGSGSRAWSQDKKTGLKKVIFRNPLFHQAPIKN